MAIGVLVVRGNLIEEQALTLLRLASQHLNRQLREIAAEVVDTGRLPAGPQRNGTM